MDVPFTTDRLIVRSQCPADAELIAEYHSDPAIAEFQDWDIPCTADRISSEQLVIEADGVLVGDLYVQVNGKAAEIGFTFAAPYQRQGYAVEVVAATVDRLLADGVQRIEARTDPKNFPSMVVLERTGFRYEGRRRAGSFVRGEWLDDDVFSLLPADRAEWLADRAAPERVDLVELTDEMCISVAKLTTHRSQEQFVAPMWASTMQAITPQFNDEGERLTPWCRAIVADGEPVGFVMCAEPTPSQPGWYLWRFLIDRAHQRRGIGSRAIAALTDHLRSIGASELATSWVDARGGPAPFYRRLGFVETGDMDDDEVVARLQW